METSSETNKKVNLEECSKEELIKKCKNLLTIAQKAKQAKDTLQEEITTLKSQLGGKDAPQEIIENLTQQKLSLITTIEDLKVKNSKLQLDYDRIENENISQKRQLSRLTDENEQLINDLEALEVQITELKNLGLQQQTQLLELEKHNKQLEEKKQGEDAVKISELQSMLSISLDEVKKLNTENCNLLTKIENLNINLKEKNNNILTISNEMQSKCDTIEALNTELVDYKLYKEKTSIILQDYETLKLNCEELSKGKDDSNRLKEKLKQYHCKLVKFATQIKALKEDKKEILRLFTLYTDQVKVWKDQLNIVVTTLKLTQKDFEIEKEEKINIEKLEELNNKLSQQEEMIESLKKYEKLLEEANQKCAANLEEIKQLKNELELSKTTEQQLAEKSGEEIMKLVNENKELLQTNTNLQEKLDEISSVKSQVAAGETQTEESCLNNNENEQVGNLKRENTELLREMNEMNQALKERGESISQLEAHCEEIMKKLQIYESQANKNVDNISQKEEIIKQLKDEINDLQKNNKDNSYNSRDVEINSMRNEIEALKEKLNSNLESSYAESETMSTSTISRTEGLNRLKDLEGSWEERYGKLRNLALKLKAKIKEQTAVITNEQAEKEELLKKLSNNVKLIQTLQNQCDKLQDELEKNKTQSNQYLSRLNTVAEEISKDKKALVSNEERICKLKQEIESLKTEKQTTENWKKQISAKVQTLRKEVEANNVLKKEFESRIAKLTADVEAKDQLLKAETENHSKTKQLLDQSNNECKKNSVLNLEMQDYERSVKELSQKIEKKEENIVKLKNQVEAQKTTINALREQTKLADEKLENEKSTLVTASTEINSYKKKLTELEELVQQKEEKTRVTTELLESSRSEIEELSTELSKVIADHQKNISGLKTEKDHFRSQVLGLQQSLRQTQETLKLKEDELVAIQSEYEGYKVRAQSVLRQNNNRDVGLEEKLSEEVSTLKSQNDLLKTELKELIDKKKILQTEYDRVVSEKGDVLKKLQESENDIEELKNQFAQLSSKHQATVNENAETVRSLKVHAETLSQCYRQQLSEQEARHNREVIELQSKLEKAPTPSETPPILPPNMPREEGEGSESVESTNIANIQHPVPLERLLGADMDQEIHHLKKQLTDQETKVIHLTALLSDTEQDLAKHVQMNKVLKEEIRRQQRSVEREKHAENLEYLKNVVFKFVTLNNGDERTRLVPVLNTILKLSPEETQKLSLVAKGDPGLKGWANYLPTWSTPSKPQ